MTNFFQGFFQNVGLPWWKIFKYIWGKSNLGRCSDIVAAISPEITSCDVGLQKILSIRVLPCQRTWCRWVKEITCYDLAKWYQNHLEEICFLLLSIFFSFFLIYNHSHNILKLFDLLPNFPFITSETNWLTS